MKKLKGMLFLLGAFSLAGTSVISARLVMGRLGNFTITSVSLIFALLCLIPVTGKKLSIIKQLKPADWFNLSLQAIFGIFLFRMLLLFGIRHTSSAEAGILTGATPAVTALLARVILGEKMGRKKWIGIFCTVAGIIIVQGLLLPDNHFVPEHILGNLLVLCACCSESTFNTCSRILAVKAQNRQGVSLPPMVQTLLVSAIAMLLCLIPAAFEQPFICLSGIGIREWLALFWYGAFVTAVAFICWYAGIRRCNATTAAAFSGMMPFTALILSVLFLKEPAGLQQWSGGILIISGMVLIGMGED
jgi:drug/metabolite transporter (DMT)-like permease